MLVNSTFCTVLAVNMWAMKKCTRLTVDARVSVFLPEGFIALVPYNPRRGLLFGGSANELPKKKSL